jgi:hypothetical protein
MRVTPATGEKIISAVNLCSTIMGIFQAVDVSNAIYYHVLCSAIACTIGKWRAPDLWRTRSTHPLRIISPLHFYPVYMKWK